MKSISMFASVFALALGLALTPLSGCANGTSHDDEGANGTASTGKGGPNAAQRQSSSDTGAGLSDSAAAAAATLDALERGDAATQNGANAATATVAKGADSAAATASAKSAPVRGWINWRGPHQNGTSDQTGLPSKLDAPLWTYDIAGRGSPVVANGKLYGVGYVGETDDLRERLFCLDAETGKELWKIERSDFLSDIIYNRYAIASPTVDPETGNIYWLTTAREAYCVTPEGKVVWSFSGPERYGWNTYPNGRTGAPAVDGDLVIFHSVSNNWGALGPPADRFFAYNKRTGEPVWTATPGEGPPRLKDSSFATPYFDWLDGKRVFYAGDGSGNVVCVNARTGDQIWRFPWSFGGINSSVVLHKGDVIAVHGKENLNSSEHGGAIKVDPAGDVKAEDRDNVLQPSAVQWRTRSVDGQPDIVAFTSSPVLDGDHVYVTVATGELVCINADTGKRMWNKKLATDQIHASPVMGDGKLYVPMNPGEFYIIKPSDSGMEELAKAQLEGNCLGAPALWNGKVYVHSTGKLYCFGELREQDDSPVRTLAKWQPDEPGKATSLQIIPDEVLLHPGEKATFTVRPIDDKGHVAGESKTGDAAEWAKFVPPTAKVKAEMDAQFNDKGELVAGEQQSAGAFKATMGNLAGTTRGRVMADLPYKEDFESYELDETHGTEDGVKFAYPPLSWAKARFVWEVRELDGNKVLAKTLDRLILQRGLSYLGHPDESNYTFQADVMTDGNRRLASDVGVINQRYIIALKGNHQQIEVVSNQERLRVSAPFRINVKTWYTLKTRVDVKEDGSGVVRAKAWPKDGEEPAEWTIEVPVADAHEKGAPGIYGFAVNGQYRVYMDNIAITRNE